MSRKQVHWVVVGVDPSVAWPIEETEVNYCGHTLTLRPGGKEQMPTIAFAYQPGMGFDAALTIVRQFMSALSWVDRAAIREELVSGGGQPVRILWAQRGNMITHKFRKDYLPVPESDRSRLALALYRDALGLNSTAYQFLGFFKIVNLMKRDGGEQVKWINSVLPHIQEHRAVSRKMELEESESDLGKYLYESGRCAVAHAFADPIVNPENVADRKRLARDLPLIQSIAEYAIEVEMGIKSQATIWREHLYQLDGFRDLLGDEFVRMIKQGQLDNLPAVKIPVLSVHVRDKGELASFADLVPYEVCVENGVVWVACRAHSGIVEVTLGLDLKNEYLLFDPEHGIRVRVEPSKESVQAQMDRLVILKDLLGNGSIVVKSADTDKRLGLSDPYIATNVDLVGSIARIDQSIERLRGELRETG